jgi:hypothetical protein
MATWKKVVVSGSAPQFTAIQVDNLTSGQIVIGGGTAGNLSSTAINGTGNIVATTNASGLVASGSFSGSFFGDGAGLSGVAASFPLTQKTPVLTTDKVFINDGASKYVTVSQLSSASWTGVSGDITISGTGTAAIGSGVVTSTMILDGTIANADINAAAAIAYTKISFAGSNIVSGSGQISYTGITNIPAGIVSGAAQIVPLLPAGTVSGSAQVSFTGLSSIPSGIVSGSAQIPALLPAGVISGSAQVASSLPAGVVSGSSQVSYTGLSSIPSGIVSGSTQVAALLPAGIVSASVLSGPATQGQVLLTTNGVAGTTITINSLGTSGTPTFASATISNDLTVQGNLAVNGTTTFINTTNTYVKDQFLLLNSGSAALGDAGIIAQYNAAGSGSALFLESTSAGTYGRWAMAYDLLGNVTSATPDEFVVSVKSAAGVAAIANAPTWGGASNGQGNMYINSSNSDIYIYA